MTILVKRSSCCSSSSVVGKPPSDDNQTYVWSSCHPGHLIRAPLINSRTRSPHSSSARIEGKGVWQSDCQRGFQLEGFFVSRPPWPGGLGADAWPCPALPLSPGEDQEDHAAGRGGAAEYSANPTLDCDAVLVGVVETKTMYVELYW
jgi:hypothetical protein